MTDRKISMILDIGADISKVKGAAQELQNLFKNTSLDPFKTKNLQSMFNGLNDALADLEKRSGKALSSLGEGRGVDASKKRVLSYIQNIAQEFQELENLGDTQLSKKIKGLSDSLEQSSKAFDRYEASMKSTKDQAKDLGKQLETLQDIQKKQERLAEIEKDLPNKRRQATRTSNEFDVIAKNLSTVQGNKTRAENRYKKFIEENAIQLTQKGTPKVLANQKEGITQEQIDKANQLYEAYDKAAKAYAELNRETQNKQNKRDTAVKELIDLENEQKTLKTSLEGVNDTLEETKSKVNQTQEAIKSFNQEGRDTASFEELKKTLKELFGDEIVKDIDNTKEGIQTLKDRIENISTDRVKELRKLFPELFNSIKGLGDSAQTMGKKVDEGLSQFSRANEASQEINHLASRLKYFFSLAGGFQLMRRAIRSATETTKELDAVMTQTAVVSKFTVGDMWKTLPEYSKYAKQLGTAIKDVYSAQTLYVQQGLSMDKAMDIGIETLKMARVANIDAAEATNSMTAALRGFNMELNETSAQRINDVYSKLAQNTASNTQEISTAMTKTAALANSANMSFENTAAFLATIIESTREGAETAGTALKTVIARFTEVKKLYSEGELLGTDEEGQEVDVNKISAALRTAGINMNDFFTGAKGLDEIFLELGSKWDSLSTVQQRYIATMAAGSRQQSRFLALMQNYNRTVELTQMAYNSAGSGQEQFEKTLDSLQAKIEKFKAEWQTFIMGIANSDVIKGIIDVGTKILEIINKIIDSISGGNGLVKSIASIVTAVGVFKGGRSLTKMIMGGAGNYGLGGIIGNWLGVKNGYGEKQEQAAAFKAFMREKGRRTEFLHTPWFGKGGVLNPKGKVEASKAAIAQAEADAKGYKDAYDKALVQEKEAENRYIDSLDKSSNTQALRGEEYENAQAKTEAARVKYEESQKSLDNIKSSATDAGMAMYQYGQAAKTAGMAAGVAAGVCMLLATALDKTGNTKAAKTLRGIGTVLTVLSGVFTVLGQVAQITGAQIAASAKTASTAIMSIPIIGWIAAVISALIILGSIMAAVIETPREAAERISVANEEIQQSTEQVKQSYEDLKTAVDNISKQEDAFDDLIFGTQEWDNAVQNLNQSILELIKLYPELAAAVKYTEEGRLYLDTESQEYKDYIESKRKASENASIASESGIIINKIADIKGKTELSFWEKLLKSGNENSSSEYLEYTNIKKRVFNFGLTDLLENSFIPQEYIKELQQAIENGIIYNKDSWLTKIEEDYKNNKINKEIYKYLKTGKSYSSVDFKIEDVIEGIQLREDYNKMMNTSFTNGAIKAIEDNNLQTSLYNNMYKIIAEKELPQLMLSYKTEDIKKLRDKYKKEYADAAGIEENKVDNDLLDSYIREQLAIKDVFKDNEFLNYFNTLTPELKTIASKIISGEEKTLTKVELGQVNQLDQTKLSPYTQIDLSKYEKNQLDILTGTLTGNNKQKVIDFSDTLGQIENYTKNVEDIISRDGDVNKYFELLDQVINSIADPKKREEAKQLLSTTAATDADAIRSTALELQKLGAQIDSSLTNQIINATNAVAKFNLKNFEEQVKALEGAKKTTKDISEGKKIVSVEDYNNLKEVFGANFDESKWALGLDGYTYIGEETNSLLTNIDKAVGILVQNSIDQTKQDIEIGERIQGVAETKIGANFNNGQWGREEHTLSEYILMMENDSNVSKATTQEIARLMGKDLSEYNFEDEDSFKAAQKALVDYYNDYYAGGVALEANQTKRDQQEAYQNMPFWGKSGDYTRQMGGSDAEQISAYIHEATEAGIDLNVLDQYTKQLKETYNLSREMAMAIAYDNMMMNKGIEELASNYEEWNKALEAGEGTGAYEEALIGLNKALKKITGTTQDFSREFLSSTENAEMFKKAAEGDTEAINQLRKAGAKDILKGFKLDNKVANELTSLIDNLDLNVEVGTELKSDYANVFQGLLDAGILTAEQVNQALETIGYEPNVQYEQMPLSSATNYTQTVYTKDSNGNMSKVESVANMDQNEMVYIPIIGGSSTSKSIGSSIKAPTYKGPTSSTVTQPKKTGGGGGGGGKEFKNDFDKYYNMVEDINELQRLRNLLETDYQQLLESENISGKAIYDNLKKQIQLLKERQKITADLAEKRKGQIFETMNDKKYASVRKYAWWNDSDQTIEIDWAAINKVKDSEKGDLIKEYVSQLENFQSQYDEQIEALEDIESTLQEIEKRGQDQYTSLEDRVRDALIKQIQDKIDELTAVDEAINNTNQKLMDSIQKELEKQRQERENAKTEEELADKEQRLAYLQQDSSGANALEIAKLQEELADARENYTDSLIDQKISELQEQNDEAAQQRQEQIELMQQSLDWQEKSGAFWDEVYRLINEGTSATGELIHESELQQLLQAQDNWESLSEEQKKIWAGELQTTVAEAVSYLYLSRQLENLGVKKGTEITFTNAEGQVLTGKVDKKGNVVVDNGDGTTTTYKDVYQSYDGTYHTMETSEDAKTKKKKTTNTSGNSSNNGSNNNSSNNSSNNQPPPETQPEKTLTDTTYEYINDSTCMTHYHYSDGSIVNNAGGHNIINDECTKCKHKFSKGGSNGGGGGGTGAGNNVHIKYKTGGLANFTGPAWLDGTPSHPELVLNARDTENFIQLKDHLAALRQAGTLNVGGDNYYDIDVHVDSLGSDYDVDMAIDRIKTRLYQDGAYRNVNTLNRLR